MPGTGETGLGGVEIRMEIRLSEDSALWTAASEHPDGDDGDKSQALFRGISICFSHFIFTDHSEVPVLPHSIDKDNKAQRGDETCCRFMKSWT